MHPLTSFIKTACTLKSAALVATFLALSGCAHTVSIRPDIASTANSTSSARIPKQVAFYLADDMRNITANTPGGGGESVSYKPYQDLEVGILKVLQNTFSSVVRLATLPDLSDLKRRNVDYLVTPRIITESSQSNFMIWSPSNFSVRLQCKIVHVASGMVTYKEVLGEGRFDLKSETRDGLILVSHGSEAGKRAATDALEKLGRTLSESSDLR